MRWLVTAAVAAAVGMEEAAEVVVEADAEATADRTRRPWAMVDDGRHAILPGDSDPSSPSGLSFFPSLSFPPPFLSHTHTHTQSAGQHRT